MVVGNCLGSPIKVRVSLPLQAQSSSRWVVREDDILEKIGLSLYWSRNDDVCSNKNVVRNCDHFLFEKVPFLVVEVLTLTLGVKSAKLGVSGRPAEIALKYTSEFEDPSVNGNIDHYHTWIIWREHSGSIEVLLLAKLQDVQSSFEDDAVGDGLSVEFVLHLPVRVFDDIIGVLFISTFNLRLKWRKVVVVCLNVILSLDATFYYLSFCTIEGIENWFAFGGWLVVVRQWIRVGEYSSTLILEV